MSARWQWMMKQIVRRLWFHASLSSILGVATALVALGVKGYIPADFSAKISADAVDHILGIIAASKLATTTFSLNIMVSAFGSATTNITPRATPLLVEDSTTQSVLATFIGSFLFSLVGVITLSTGLYGTDGRVVLFAVAIGVILLIIYTLLRWIDHLARLGRMSETIDRVKKAAIQALEERRQHPFLGGSQLCETMSVPVDAKNIHPATVGHVQHVNMQALGKLAGKGDGAIFVHMPPGSFVDQRTRLASVMKSLPAMTMFEPLSR